MDAKNHVKDIKHVDLRDDLRNVKDSIAQTATHARERASDVFEHSLKGAKEKGAELQENVVTYVKENPVKSVGIAMLAGFIAALVMRK
ncbi:MAG: DUF883 C-terminal domain-containing protein [Gammaproteobacteria bacterium]